MTQKISPQTGVLRVVAAGDFSVEEAKRIFKEMLEAMAQNQVEKVLLDGRGVVGNPRTMERFYYSEYAAESVAVFVMQGKLHAPKFAYVLQPPLLDSERFGESVAVNRGMHVKVFENDLDPALKWLEDTHL